MRYSNSQPPEGINVTPIHPLRELWLLGAGAIALVAAVALLAAVVGRHAASWIPFSYERQLAGRFPAPTCEATPLRQYLSDLSDEVQRSMEIAPPIVIDVRLHPGTTRNAFATFGGNVVLYRGLLAELPNEDALYALLAHEYAHVAHRDPARALGGAAGAQLALAALFGRQSVEVLGEAGLYTALSFSRAMERAADAAALAALAAGRGHVSGAIDLFERLTQLREGGEPPAFFSTHPHDAARLRDVRAFAARAGLDPGEVRPLPAAFSSWLNDLSATCTL